MSRNKTNTLSVDINKLIPGELYTSSHTMTLYASSRSNDITYIDIIFEFEPWMYVETVTDEIGPVPLNTDMVKVIYKNLIGYVIGSLVDTGHAVRYDAQ